MAPNQKKYSQAPEMSIDPSKRYTASMETTLGTIVISLDPIAAPKTVNNFVFLSEQGYYDDVIFHRIINGFMCQGGDPAGSGLGGPGYEFVDELPSSHRYVKGAVAMANRGPNTNGSQFFICSKDLSPKDIQTLYSIFGQVVKGLEVVVAMQNVAIGSGNRPKTDVVIKSVTITVAD